MIILIGAFLIVSSAACTNTPKEAKPSEEKLLKDAITKHPDSLLLKENLIQYYRDQNNLPTAILETNKAIAADSANARLWDIKATLHFENNDTTEAIQSFEKAVQIEPKIEYLLSLGSLYAETKNAKALNVADGILHSPKQNAAPQALFIKGLYYSFTNHYQQAIAYFDQCLKIDYTNVMAYREKGICLYNMAQYNAAIETLEKAVTLQSTYDEAYYWMGRCYEKLQQPQAAIMNYKAAIQIDPTYTAALEALKEMQASK